MMEHLSDYYYRVIWDILAAPRKVKKGRKGNCALAIAACNDGEGASTIALNIASAFSINSMKRVVLVDGNLRTPVLHSFFGVTREPGLTDLVNGDTGIEETVIEITEQRFHFISAGRQVQNPALIFEGPNFVDTVDNLRSSYDLIIFDTSSLIPYPETPILGSAMDGLILVLEAENTRWEVGQAAKTNLETAGVTLFGAILNKREYYIPRSIYKLL